MTQERNWKLMEYFDEISTPAVKGEELLFRRANYLLDILSRVQPY
jgi:hypothetical protein